MMPGERVGLPPDTCSHCGFPRYERLTHICLTGDAHARGVREERARIVAWLRKYDRTTHAHVIAADIERGEHEK
jgi:hypothetical protein